MNNEFYVSVDVETSGPIPGEYSLLSIGACLVHEPSKSIYIELQPEKTNHDPEAVAVSGLSLDRLTAEGLHPREAMLSLERWLNSICPPNQKPIFVGLNAPFDWSFINYYFHKFTGANPFGFSAIDIKAYFMGSFHTKWAQTKSSKMTAMLRPLSAPTHNAQDDAKFQAELFSLMMSRQGQRPPEG
jgi:DNA polymerase III epsilon subunit-like protein